MIWTSYAESFFRVLLILAVFYYSSCRHAEPKPKTSEDGFQICSGDLVLRKVSLQFQRPLHSLCLSDDGSVGILILTEGEPGEGTGKSFTTQLGNGTKKAEEGFLRYTFLSKSEDNTKTGTAVGMIKYELKIKHKGNGIYTGTLTHSQQFRNHDHFGNPTVVDGIHFFPGERHGFHWSYTGDTGPDRWGKLRSEFEPCSNGKAQSPINLAKALTLPTGQACTIEFSYKAAHLFLLNNGHAAQAEVDPGHFIVVGKKRYELLQFHVHTPSEHFLYGNDYDVEIHFVHQAEDKSLAVVGVFGRAKRSHEENEPLKTLLSEFPRQGEMPLVNQPKSVSKPFLIDKLLPPAGRRAYYHYLGSLTTPPCTEGIAWYVMRYIVPISSDQLKDLRVMGGGKNARRIWQGTGVPPVMALNHRSVHYCRDLSVEHSLPHQEN